VARAAALLAANPGGAAVTLEVWIDRYRRAWETADADEVVDLFTADASYRSIVFREPYLGSDAIRQYWGAQRRHPALGRRPHGTARHHR
jgi:hypothetical protein